MKKNIGKMIYILFLTICLTGCGTIHQMSLPTIGRKIPACHPYLPPHSKIKLNGLSLYLWAYNDEIIKKHPICGMLGEFRHTPFEIRIALMPHKLGFSFNPQKIIFKIKGLNTPLTITGSLGKRSEWQGLLRGGYAPWFLEKDAIILLDDTFIELTEINKFYIYKLKADMSPLSPEIPFSLNLSEALQYNSSSILGKIDFEEYKWIDGSF